MCQIIYRGPYDTIPVNSLRQGCSVRRWGGGGVLRIKWNKRQNRWFFWNKANPEQSPDAIAGQENYVFGPEFEQFQRWNRTANAIFSGPPSAAIFNIHNPYSGWDYHERSVQNLVYSTWTHHKRSFDRRSRHWKNLSWPFLVFQARFQKEDRLIMPWQCSDDIQFVLGVLCFTWYLSRLPVCKLSFPNPLCITPAALL